MNRTGLLLGGCLAFLSVVTGCGSTPQATELEVVDVEAVFQLTEEQPYHEWKKIFLVVPRDGKATRTHVGFLDRRFTRSDPDGKFFVLDRTHNVRGFVLQSGRSFVAESQPDGTRKVEDLGMKGLDLGIKDILKVAGGLEFELVQSASTPTGSGG